MTPDSGPDNRLPEQAPRPKRFYFLLVLLVIAASAALYAANPNTVREREPITDKAEDQEAILQGVQDGPDIIGPVRVTAPAELKKAAMPIASEAMLLFCYDNAEDCGRFAQEYCSNRSGVQLNVYSSGATVPCQVTCANGEGATCQEPPPNTAPAPKKPGDVTSVQPRVSRTER